jgi:hypothetical protein
VCLPREQERETEKKRVCILYKSCATGQLWSDWPELCQAEEKPEDEHDTLVLAFYITYTEEQHAQKQQQLTSRYNELARTRDFPNLTVPFSCNIFPFQLLKKIWLCERSCSATTTTSSRRQLVGNQGRSPYLAVGWQSRTRPTTKSQDETNISVRRTDRRDHFFVQENRNIFNSNPIYIYTY